MAVIPEKTDWMKEQMAHPATKQYARDIYNLVKKLKPKTALEIGCMWAVSTSAILLASDAHLTSVDLSEYTHAPEELEALDLLGRWRFIHADSRQYWQTHESKFDFVYIDGDHSYKYASIDIREGWRRVNEGGVLAIDDALHKWNKTGKYGVASATLEQLHRQARKVNFEGSILWLRK